MSHETEFGEPGLGAPVYAGRGRREGQEVTGGTVFTNTRVNNLSPLSHLHHISMHPCAVESLSW